MGLMSMPAMTVMSACHEFVHLVCGLKALCIPPPNRSVLVTEMSGCS